jgi:uncharacterized protein YneF (UPF0154 family)
MSIGIRVMKYKPGQKERFHYDYFLTFLFEICLVVTLIAYYYFTSRIITNILKCNLPENAAKVKEMKHREHMKKHEEKKKQDLKLHKEEEEYDQEVYDFDLTSMHELKKVNTGGTALEMVDE